MFYLSSLKLLVSFDYSSLIIIKIQTQKLRLKMMMLYLKLLNMGSLKDGMIKGKVEEQIYDLTQKLRQVMMLYLKLLNMGSLKDGMIKGKVEEQSQEKKIRRKVGLKKYYKHKPIFKTADKV